MTDSANRQLRHRLVTAAVVLAVLAALGALLSGADGTAGLTALAAHALLPLALVPTALAGRGGQSRWLLAALILTGGCGIVSLWPGLPHPARLALFYLHAAAGVVALGLAMWSVVLPSGGTGRHLAAVLVLALLLVPAAAYFGDEYRQSGWTPPRYDSQACYRFLTATTAQQSGESLFPSALRIEAPAAPGCADSGCHMGVHSEWHAGAHAGAGSSTAYRATYADFVRRRGADAARWCRGCHEPGALAKEGGGAMGVGCEGCHAVSNVHALYGSAPLVIEARPPPPSGLEVRLRSKRHRSQSLRASLHASVEFCAGCHRKNYNLPQNRYRWMPGPDEYRDWQGSRYSGALFAAGPPAGTRSCVGCHDPHAGTPADGTDSGMRLDLFLRPPTGPPAPVQSAPGAGSGTLLLDVVVENRGIGHTFPTGMPDLQESWVEVRAFDREGREVARHGVVEPAAELPGEVHVYRLLARDRNGQAIRHGNLDEMVTVSEWRRIPAGEADLARFRLAAPAEGLGRISARLLRRRRPDFSRWAGERLRPVEVLATADVRIGSDAGAGGAALAARWRSYGEALAGVRAYPHAVQALRQALALAPGDPETLLALARVYLDEGDLLAALEQVRQARTSGASADRMAAWEGAVLRRMGQPGQAAALLAPLTRRYPRDRRLRYEMGQVRVAELRNAEAAREFEAMLDVDPTDVAGHFNLMLCLQRLNRLTDARREETLYRLLRGDSGAPSETTTGREQRALKVYTMETLP